MNPNQRDQRRAQIARRLRLIVGQQKDGNKPAVVSFAQMMKQLRGE